MRIPKNINKLSYTPLSKVLSPVGMDKQALKERADKIREVNAAQKRALNQAKSSNKIANANMRRNRVSGK